MRKRLTAVLLVAVMLCSVLSGCGSEGTGETGGSDSKETSGGTNLNLSIGWWGGDIRNQYTQELLDEYSEMNSKITFSATPTSWDGYFEKLSTQAAGGNLPTIFQMDYLYLTTYANNGTLTDLTPYIENGTIDVSTIDEALLDSGKINGIQSSIPLTTSILTFPYNPIVLAEAGLDNPTADWTWEDFERMCMEVKEKTGKFGYAQNYVDVNVFHYWLRQYGEKLFNDEGTALAYKDDTLATEFIALHKRLTDAGAMTNPDEWVAYSANALEAGPIPMNEAAFNFSFSTYPMSVSGTNDKIMLNTPPTFEGAKKALWLKPGMFFCVSETATPEEKQAAAEFINWFINSEQAADKMGTERGIPASSSVREYLINGELSKKEIEMFEFYDVAEKVSGECPSPDPERMSEVNAAFASVMDQVMYNQLTPEEGAIEFRKQANDILARNTK